MDSIDEFLGKLQNLPPSPIPLPELFSALSEADSDISKAVDLISFDPALTAKLLQLCNSAFFATSTRAGSVAEAVNRLGFKTVYQMVAAIKGTQVFRSAGKSYGLDEVEAWRQAVRAALAAQFMAEDIGADPGLFFTAGLLHDIGRLILGEAFKEDYTCVVCESAETGRSLVELEKLRFGVEHAGVGGRLLARWKFPAELVCSVAFHHNPQGAGAVAPSAACVSLASALSENVGLEDEAKAMDDAEALQVLGWSTQDLSRYSQRLNENVAYVETMYGLQA